MPAQGHGRGATQEEIEEVVEKYQRGFYAEALLLIAVAFLSSSIPAYGQWGPLGSIGMIFLAAGAFIGARYLDRGVKFRPWERLLSWDWH